MNPAIIDVVDASSVDNGFLQRNRDLHPKAVSCDSVASLVANVMMALGGANHIRRLRIFGHGSPGRQVVGGGRRPAEHQVIDLNLFGRVSHRNELAKLTPHFASDSVVQLHGCSVGSGSEGRKLVARLANLWHATVQAALDRQFADVKDAFEGVHYIQANGALLTGGCLFPSPTVDIRNAR